jgi:DNA-binding transcriptional LysR family regulator
MALNLHLLRLFAAVAAEGSFSRAAEVLHVSQPAVSRGVREFEAQLGTRLLERGAGGVSLTAEGAALMRHAGALFAAERAAEEDVAAWRGLARGSLTVGASTTIATWFLPPLLAAFQAAHPAIELRLRIANTAAIAEALLARELEVALVEGPVDQPGIQGQPWREDRMVLIAGAPHPLARAGGVLDPASLAPERIILRERGSGTRDVADAALAALGVSPAATLEVGSTEMIVQVVAAGLGVAIVSLAAARDQMALGRLVALRVRGLAVSRQLTRLSLPGRQPSAAAVAFGRLLDVPG